MSKNYSKSCKVIHAFIVLAILVALTVAFLVTYFPTKNAWKCEDKEEEEESAVEDIVGVEWLAENKNKVVLLDATYQPTPSNNTDFESSNGEAYEKEHIPGAVFFDFAMAYHSSKYIVFDLHTPEEFEKYIRQLGVNAEDHVIVYAREAFAGMLWASRVWWTFKLYGHEKVSVLNGGLNAWKKAGKSVSNVVPDVEPGNWKAKPIDKSIHITFEELSEGRPGIPSMFDDLSKINMMDGRPAGEFTGEVPLQIPTEGVPGYRLPKSKNLPLDKVIGQEGIKSKAEIEKALENAGFNRDLQTVTICNKGVQASVLALILKQVGVKARVFNVLPVLIVAGSDGCSSRLNRYIKSALPDLDLNCKLKEFATTGPGRGVARRPADLKVVTVFGKGRSARELLKEKTENAMWELARSGGRSPYMSYFCARKPGNMVCVLSKML